MSKGPKPDNVSFRSILRSILRFVQDGCECSKAFIFRELAGELAKGEVASGAGDV